MELKDVTNFITSHRMEVVQEMRDEFYVIKDGIIIDSKKAEQKSVVVEVNEEVDMSVVKELTYVNRITEHEENKLIEI